MARKYRNLPCAYCGAVTGKNTGEHVVPDCLYTSHVPKTFQWLKIAACEACNHGFSISEAHFKGIVSASGQTPSAARQELIKEVLDSFRHPISGKTDFLKFDKQLMDSGKKTEQGQPIFMLQPHKDDEVCFIARKIVRGLVHTLDYKTIIPDNHVRADMHIEPPAEFEDFFADSYAVPNTFSSRYAIFDPINFPDFADDIHSLWQIKLYDLPMTCVVMKKPVQEIETASQSI